MSGYEFDYGGPSMYNTTLLPNGQPYLTRVLYSGREQGGVAVLVATSCISLVAVIGLLIAISTSAFNTRTTTNQHLFVRTHVAAYFICLLCSDLLQAIGSIMNARWVQEMSVTFDGFCQLQGAIKQAADVGTALWSLIIAIHTFNILFLQVEMHKFVLWAALIGGWAATGTIVLIGPASLNTAHRGPFFGISGYWCWISTSYPTQRITLDYMIMFMSALFCFILYSLIFLRLRGNIVVHGWRMTFRLHPRTDTDSWRGREEAAKKNYTTVVARRMLFYPVAYTVLLLPIAAARFSSWAGHDVPFGVTIFTDTIFLMSGLVNVILFSTTRRILPPRSVFTWLISRPRSMGETDTLDSLPDAGLVEKAHPAGSAVDLTLDRKAYDVDADSISSFSSAEGPVPILGAPPLRRVRSPDGSPSVRPDLDARDSYGLSRSPFASPAGTPQLDGGLGPGQDVVYLAPTINVPLTPASQPTTPFSPSMYADGSLRPSNSTASASGGAALGRSNTSYSAASVYDLYGARSPTAERQLRDNYPGTHPHFP